MKISDLNFHHAENLECFVEHYFFIYLVDSKLHISLTGRLTAHWLLGLQLAILLTCRSWYYRLEICLYAL